MKRTKQEYLNCYYQWMETGELPRQNGLCYEFIKFRIGLSEKDELLELFTPTEDDRITYRGNPFYNDVYWGYGLEETVSFEADRIFSPLRQTIVLFMAEMAGED